VAEEKTWTLWRCSNCHGLGQPVVDDRCAHLAACRMSDPHTVEVVSRERLAEVEAERDWAKQNAREAEWRAEQWTRHWAKEIGEVRTARDQAHAALAAFEEALTSRAVTEAAIEGLGACPSTPLLDMRCALRTAIAEAHLHVKEPPSETCR
jgi:hypothetical protein